MALLQKKNLLGKNPSLLGNLNAGKNMLGNSYGRAASIAGAEGPPPVVTGLLFNDLANSMYQGPAAGIGIGVN